MYDDFPILSEQDYLTSAYNASNSLNVADKLNQVLCLLDECKQLSFNSNLNVNLTLSKAIVDARKSIDTAMENLNLLFNVKVQASKQVKDFDVFAFLNGLLNAVENLNKINAGVEKSYQKSATQKTASQLLAAAQNITSALCESKVKLFKYL